MGLNKISCQSCGQTIVGTASQDGLCPACGNKLDGSGRQAAAALAAKMPWHLRNASLTWGLALLCVAGMLQLAGHLITSSMQDEAEARLEGFIKYMESTERMVKVQAVCDIASVPPLAGGVVLLGVAGVKKVRRRAQ